MCEWLKKIFGCKCSCKHCHCGEENKEEAVNNLEAPVETTPEEAPTEEHFPEPANEDVKEETESL